MTSIRLLLDKTLAVVRRDLLIAVRYRASLFVAAAGGVFEVAGLYYLAKGIGPAYHPEGMNAYAFLLVGTGLYTFMLMGISCFVSTIQEAQQSGTLEMLMTMSTSPWVVLLLNAASAFAGKGLTFLLYVAGGLLLAGAGTAQATLLPVCVALVLSVCIAAAIGILAAAFQILLQKGSGIVWLLGTLVWLLSGAMFPVSVLPHWLQWVSVTIPFTHCLRAMRLAMFSGASDALTQEIGLLIAFASVLLPASVVLFTGVLRRARMAGTLSYS
jgi:ABC-2 type transport system permease protein